ncbi:delta-lactam-biosynthetic de-N-acetylase [Bacillus methanolicus]|uniref:Putative 30,6 kDa protein in fumA 3'region n=1 Tax=Bacillus methanolicus (strain MGA3 / ATCC 53907) TaxID=796606 RepID=I3E2Q6_BACMM|nr:delta-lactam-biosynthetic de-N-acetylase [Bacillus methanolicus]AIE59122.1 putative 30,6 kDa protein in fumA 3'region [Bacillus methanolicus MGA3]EIJ80777.1 delta-lactam-biosynthetic de-N-acetylase [Bacillus methanolicus MGA3]
MKKACRVLITFISLFLFFLGTTYARPASSAIHWGFKKGENGKPAEAGKTLDDLLEKYGAVYKGDPNKKDIYLTFDNGYENGFTAKILDVLKKEQVPAAFFITGHYLEREPGLVKRMAKEGHIIGNHSWFHPDLTKVSDERLKNELERVRTETEKLTGQKQMAYLRPPRGIFSERTLDIAKQQGYTHVFWSLAFMDWRIDQQKGWKYSYDSIMKQIHPGAILLLHTVSRDNAEALEKVIKDLKKQGYQFKNLNELMMDNTLKERMLY